MTEEIPREKRIEILARGLETLNSFEKEWAEEERKKGNDPDKDISIRWLRQVRLSHVGWLYAEKELLELEKQLKGAKPITKHDTKEGKSGNDKSARRNNRKLR